MLKVRNRNMVMMGAASLLCALTPCIFAGDVEIVSTRRSGAQAKEQSREPSISADGRFVCFESRANNLVPDDTNGVWDIFVKDMNTGRIRRVSVSSSGVEANDFSTMAVISADGSTVAFMSAATNLVPDDTNNDWDYFVHDLQTGEVTRVSVSSNGEQGNGGADCDCRVYKFPGVSENGQIISFQSSASNLVPDDTNEVFDIFRHDRGTGETVRITLSTDGQEANNNCWIRDMSPNGRFIVYHSSASNLVPDDTNDQRDIFIHDFETGVTERINIPVGGGETDDLSDSPRVSADGRFVAYASLATNLVPDDTNDQWDVFLRDRKLGTTSRISVSSKGAQGDVFSRHPSISADGRKITFHSVTTNLVPGDTNDERDIFMHDRFLGETIIVSDTIDGTAADKRSYDGFISLNGRWIVFDSLATNLVTNDLNGTRDIFRFDLLDQMLALSSPEPGLAGEMNTWEITGASPGATVVLVYGSRLGESRNIPGCTQKLEIRNPHSIKTVDVNADGLGQVSVFVGQKVAGRTLLFQAFEPISCRKTDVIQVSFE